MTHSKPYIIFFAVLAMLIGAAALAGNAWHIKYIVLWTDILIFVLIIAVSMFVIQARQKPHLRTPWRHVLQRRLAMSAAVLLSVYVLIGLLDSVHFREALPEQDGQTETHYSGDVISLFDKLVTPLKDRQEKSYSAPFAYHLFTKEMIDTPQGQVRDYPRLKYGGQHLQDPEQEFWHDVIRGAALAFLYSLLIWLAIFAVINALVARHFKLLYADSLRRIVTGKTRVPFLAMLITLGAVIYLAMFIVVFADKYHILGTDKVGNDVLYLSLKSIRTGLVIGTLTTLIMLPFAIMLGIMAGHFRGWVDDIIQYLYTTLNSIPGVLLIAASILSLQVYMANNPEMFETVTERADLRLLFLCMILGITSWTGLCRLLRGETFKISQLDYIEAASAFGTGHLKTMLRHILPNVMHIVLISVVLDFSGLVLAEAVLSYVGVGVDPITNSWGNMINSARLEMAREPVVWWSLAAAFVFMFTLVLSANLFSDAVRDAFDPRISRAK